MATIKTAIQIYDGVTGPLQSMHRAMSIVLNSFEAMQSASGRSVDVSAIRDAREEMAKAEVAFDAIEQNIKQAEQAQGKFNNRIRQGSSAADSLWSKLRGVATAVGAGVAVNRLVGLSDSMTSTRARLNLIVDDGGSVAALEKQIMASAQRSRASYLSTAQAVSQMGLMAGDAFSSTDELITFTETLNKQFVIAGTNAAGAEAATLQLTQAMASGVLRGEELNSVFEQAPNVIQSIADYMDVPIGQVRALAADGQITADIVKNAMLAATESVNRDFESMPMTWGQVWNSFQNMAILALTPVLDGINWLANNISIIGPIVLGLGAAFMVFQIAAHWTQIAAVAMAVYHGAVNFLSIGFGILTGNTAAASAAVFTFNSALLANPIVWVVMLIAVLIAALYAGVAAYNKFTGAGVSATGIIGGAFAVLGAHILNTFVIPLQNKLAMLANFFGNVFNDPVAAVQVLFYDMCLTVIGYIKNLAGAVETLVNKIPGVTVDITSGLDNFYAGLKEAQQKVKDESGWVEYVKKMDFIDYSDAASAGYKFGEGIADKVSNLFGFSAMDGYGVNDSIDRYNIRNTLDNIYNNTGDTAGNTAEMNNILDITEEDIKYMRDIAEREAINRYTTAEIKVEQRNTNYISGGTDLDGVMDAWANDFAQKLDISEEGVHD